MKRSLLFTCVTALAFCGSAPAQVELRYRKSIAEVSGPGWALRYRVFERPHLMGSGRDRVFLSNGRSLRWIDTKQGIVLARWLLPERIKALETPDPAMVRDGTVTVAMNSPSMLTNELSVFVLDPRNPQLPHLPPASWGMERNFATEATADIPAEVASGRGDPQRLAEAIAGVQEMARRDPLSPWFHFHLGKLLRGVHDPKSEAEFQAAADCCLSSSEFFELFAVSSALQEEGQESASETAFQNGWRDYQQRGFDPRLFIGMSPNFIYPATWNLPPKQYALTQERLYQLGPWSAGSKTVFPLLAADAAKHGRTAEARLWQQRADDAQAHSLAIHEPMTARWLDRPLRWAAAAILAAILYVAALFTKYFSRGRDDIVLRRSLEGPGGNFRFLRVEYWSWTERVNFLLIVALGWAALGISGAHYRAWWRFAIVPFQSRNGSFGGPEFARFLEKELPSTPERELLMEINRRQSATDHQPLTLPTPAQMERAFRGGGPEAFPRWAMGGPLNAAGLMTRSMGGSMVQSLPVLYAVLLPLALASFLMPQWPPLSRKRDSQGWLPHLLPGVSTRWSFLGGVLLLAWCQELVRILVIRGNGSLEIFSYSLRPGMEGFWRSSFGYNGPVPQPPHGWEIYGAAVVIWVVNLVVVSVWGFWEHGRHENNVS